MCSTEEKKRHQDYQVSTGDHETAESKNGLWGGCRRGDSCQTDEKHHISIRISAFHHCADVDWDGGSLFSAVNGVPPVELLTRRFFAFRKPFQDVTPETSARI